MRISASQELFLFAFYIKHVIAFYQIVHKCIDAGCHDGTSAFRASYCDIRARSFPDQLFLGIGSIKDEILNVDELAVELVKFLKAEYPGLLAQRYEVSEENDIIELISAVAVNRKCLSKGGEPDYSKAAALIIDDFRSGKLGHITLERPKI